ncbi:MAG: hypothetical protein P4L74_03390 [Candidatus Doudnabacteria bacterium]|nr:hypothetical protein [Candidatus Doudnabacteria bacterium]
MPTIEEFDSKQTDVEGRADDLRRQIPKEGEIPKDAKPFSPAKRWELEAELEEMRHPHREPERRNPFSPKNAEDASNSKPEPAGGKKGIMTEVRGEEKI